MDKINAYMQCFNIYICRDLYFYFDGVAECFIKTVATDIQV